MFQELTTKKSWVKKKFKCVLFVTTFFNLVDVKSQILYNQLTSNLV